LDALLVIVTLLEKASVLLALVLVLVLVKPARVWLRETGRDASPRRRLFLVIALGAVAVWGVFLGMSIGGQAFNVRMLGIVVAGFLGGRKVGAAVGAIAGAVYAYRIGAPMGPWAFTASVIVGLSAGWWSRRFGTKVLSVAIGATVVQVGYHLLIGGVMVAVETNLAIHEASNVWLHVAKITANAAGATVFLALLNLVGELERYRDEARESRVIVRSARLEALQYQVRPHFLFNLLNTLAFLIRTDPVKARELTLDLADFLRYTLSDDRDETTLRDELEQIRRYVELERARFGDGLTFSVTTDPELDVAGIHVPPLILQPLVENAIRHGTQDGIVEVQVDLARAADGGVVIKVLDTGPGPEEKPRSRDGGRVSGLGLRNVRERLTRYYNTDIALELMNREDGSGAMVRFCIPEANAKRTLPRPASEDAS